MCNLAGAAGGGGAPPALWEGMSGLLSNCQCKFTQPAAMDAIECVAFVCLNVKLKFQFDMRRAHFVGVIRRRPHPSPSPIFMYFKIATVYGIS